MGNIETSNKNQLAFHYLEGDKFKTNIIGLLLRTSLSRENATKTALLSAVLKNGSKAYPSRQELAIKMEEMYGAVFDVSLLKKGDEQIIFFYLELLKNNDELLEEGCTFLQQFLSLPLAENGTFLKAVVDREKVTLRKKIQGRRDDKREYAKEKCIEVLGEGEAYGVYADGYEEDLDGIDGKDLFAHYEYLLENSQVELLFCGDKIAAQGIKEKLCGFGFSNGRKLAPTPVAPLNHHKPVEKNEAMDLAQGRLCMAFTSEIPPASQKFYALLLANELLGGGASSLLFRRVREEQGLCYYISTTLQRMKSVILVQTGIAPKDYGEVVTAVNAACAELAEGKVDAEQLNYGKEALIRYYTAMEDSGTALMNWKTDEILLGSGDSIAEACQFITEVTAANVSQAAATLKFSASYFLQGKEVGNLGDPQKK